VTIVDNTVSVDVLIVGGGPGGLAVARGYREAGGRGTVLLVSADEHPPYARLPLTKDYLRGESEADDWLRGGRQPVPAGRRGCVGERRNAATCGPVG
jgi:NADPH-dependent 2,4-dienoyl-CoA reductase/sulfur reductase-like enzyme